MIIRAFNNPFVNFNINIKKENNSSLNLNTPNTKSSNITNDTQTLLVINRKQ